MLRSSHSERAISDGAGSSSRLTRPPRTTASHAAMSTAQQQQRRLHGVTPSVASARSRSSTTVASVRLRGCGRSTSSVGDDPAGARRHQHDPVGQQHGLLDVVRDQHHRPRFGAQRLGEPRLRLRAGEGVERRERLVQAQQRAAGEQRAQEGDALAHAAGQRRGAGLLEPGEAELLEARVRLAAGLGLGFALDADGQRRVVERRQPRQQGVSLRHERGGWRVHAPAIRRVEPAHQREQGRLAAPARADDGDQRARLDLEVHAVQRDDLTEALADAAHGDPASDTRPH